MAGQQDAVIDGCAHLQRHADQIAHEEYRAVYQSREGHVDVYRALNQANQHRRDDQRAEGDHHDQENQTDGDQTDARHIARKGGGDIVHGNQHAGERAVLAVILIEDGFDLLHRVVRIGTGNSQVQRQERPGIMCAVKGGIGGIQQRFCLVKLLYGRLGHQHGETLGQGNQTLD